MDGPRLIEHFIQYAGLHKAEVARRVGVRPQAMTKWLNGAAMPGPENLKKLDKVLGADGAVIRAFAPDLGHVNGCTVEDAIRDTDRLSDRNKDLLLRLFATLADRPG